MLHSCCTLSLRLLTSGTKCDMMAVVVTHRERAVSIRKREWTTAKGEARTAWGVDYADQGGQRRLKTFARKKDADAFAATAKVEIRSGIHTADSASVTIAEAG